MPRKRSSRKPPLAQPPSRVPAFAQGSAGLDIPGAGPRPERAAWLALLLVPVLSVAFVPILRNSFVGWDDPGNFLENPDFRGLGWTQIRWAWTTRLLGVYQPLSWMLLEAEFAIRGLDPRGYHLTSLILICVDALVLDALVVALLKRSRPEESARHPWRLHASTALAVALFMAHPLRVEVVAWASCQPYLPCALFSMLAVLAYLRAHPVEEPPRLGWSLAALLLYTAALLCKAVAIPLPLVLLILDVYPLGRLGLQHGRLFGRSAWSCWLEKVPYLVLGALFAVIAFKAKQENESLVSAPLLAELPERFAQACYGAWIYPLMTLWPSEMTAYYPLPAARQWEDTRFVLARLMLVVAAVVLIALRRTLPGLLAAWLSYLVILAPNSGLVRIGNQIAADRYGYIAMLGLVPLLAVALATALRPIVSPRQPAIALALVLATLGVEIGLTRRQCAIWHDSVTLWTHAYDHGAANNSRVLNNLAYSLTLDGRAAEAVPLLRRALELEPSYANGHHSLATALVSLGRDDEAATEFQEALRLDPGHAESYRDLELLRSRLKQGKNEAAVSPGRGR
jgi:protein O-mannosyl-transferase